MHYVGGMAREREREREGPRAFRGSLPSGGWLSVQERVREREREREPVVRAPRGAPSWGHTPSKQAREGPVPSCPQERKRERERERL